MSVGRRNNLNAARDDKEPEAGTRKRRKSPLLLRELPFIFIILI